MNTYQYGFVLFVALLLSACGGGGGGSGGGTPPANAALAIALASDAPPARVIPGSEYQEVFAFTVNGSGNTVPISSVSVAVSGDPALVAALSLQLTNSGAQVGTLQQVSGGRVLFSGLSVGVPAGAAKRFSLLAAVTGNVLWNTGERTKKVSFAVSQSDVVAEGTVTVTGSATGAPMYRERGRIVFPLGVQVDYGYGMRWTTGNNIWIGDMETSVAYALTNDVGDTGGGGGISFPRIRFGMTPSPSFDRIAFGELNDDSYNEIYGSPYSIKTDGTNLVRHTPRVCESTPSREMAYSPNGNFLVYRTICPQGGGVWKSDLVAVRTDGSGGFKITSDARDEYSPVVSADGTEVYFLSCSLTDGCKVYVVGVNFTGGYATEAPRVLTGEGWNWMPTDLFGTSNPDLNPLYPSEGGLDKRWLSLSPDGKKLLVTFKKNTGPSMMGIYDIAGNTMTEVGEGSGAYWAKDGRILFFKPSWQEKDERNGVIKSNDLIPAYFMEGDGSDVRDASGICLGANWQSCAFGLPLLPPL
ncbi:MAG: hypothetical protein NUV42_02110 [Candidatus Yonathbacteria bacterium]|nr:hypothetical protein [Candidatus Yonathbacteria bacterium]